VTSPRPLWRNRDFNLLWGGGVASTLGTQITAVAYPLLVLALTQSPAKAGLVGFARGLPFALLFLPAGVLVDRWDRRRVMLAADAGRAVALGSLAVAIAAGRPALPHILLVAFVEGALFVFFTLAESAALPRVVPKAQLGAAVARNEARQEAAGIAGPPGGGLLYELGRTLPFAVDALSYAVSFVAVLLIRQPLQEGGVRERGRVLAGIRDGVACVWSHPFLRATTPLNAGANLVFGGLLLALIVRAREVGASPSLIGLMLACAGLGGVAGAIAAPWVQRRIPPRVVIIGSLCLWAAGTALLALPESVAVLGLVLGAMYLAGAPYNVVVGSYKYFLVPDRLLGRVTSVGRLVSWSTVPLGPLLAGLLLETLGAAEAILALAAAMAAVAVAAVLSRSVRTVPRPEALAPRVG
jgi:MFS family permease